MIDKIKQIKYSRLSKEEQFFLNTTDGIKSFKLNEYPQSVFWKKNNIVLFEEDFEHGDLRVNFKLIWYVFEEEFYHTYIETQSLIRDMVIKYTDLCSLNPILDRESHESLVTNYNNLIPRRLFTEIYNYD